MGVAKKRSAGAVQQRRCGLIEAFDVIHVVKEERQLERPGDLSWLLVVVIMNNIKEH